MKNTHSRHRIALAVAAALLGIATPAGSAVVVTGPYFSNPGAVLVNGPDLNLPNTLLWIAGGGNGSFSATAGAQVDLGGFAIGAGGATGTGLLNGTGTAMRLHADGNNTRLDIGTNGTGSLEVSAGALLDGRTNAAACLLGPRWCTTFVGNAAGSTGTLTVTGAGSEARLLGSFIMGNINVNGGFGIAGATTHGTAQVLNGGLLRTQDQTAGVSWLGPNNNGNERGVADVLIDGANSRWVVEADLLGYGDTRASFANGALATATLAVQAGGQLLVQGDAGRNYNLRLGTGGSFTGTVSGAGSAVLLSGDANNGAFHIGEGGTAALTVSNGGKIGGGRWVQVGLNGGTATLNLAGGSADFSRADVQVGNAATGTLNISGGGRLDARQLNLATGSQASSGTVTLDGANSFITLGGVDTHRLAVGGSGTGAGTLTVMGGALLDATLDAAACANRWCTSFIGQMAGANARFTVTGVGSEARFLGDFDVGEIGVARPAIEGWTGGEINGATQARVEVLAGGKLTTESLYAGGWFFTGSQGGGERSFGDLVVSGTGSTWLIAPSAIANRDASLNLARSRNAVTTLDISDGGLLRLQAPTGRNAAADLTAGRYAPGDPTAGGGSSVTKVRGAGSRFEINGDTSRLVVGNNAGGTALLQVKDGGAVVQTGSTWSYLNIGEGSATGRVEILSGGQVSGARAVNVGSGGSGYLLISGAGSLLTTDRNGSFVGQINVGQQGLGRMDVQNGGMASAFSLQVGNGYDHNNNRGLVVIDGAGTKVELDAVDWHRMSINSGNVIVSGGALLDGTVNAAACTGHWCGVFIANNAGDDGAVTITGSGSTARFLSNFNVGQAYATAPPDTPWSVGVPGGTSFAQINVLAGGRLETETVSIANGPTGPAADGSEGVIAQIRVKGAGSVWQVSGANGSAASFSSGLGNAANTLTDIQIADGGQLLLTADANTAAFIQLGANGGINRMSVSGAGSKIVYGTTNNAGLWIGRNGATSSLALSSGGAIEGINRLQVGNTGATGTLSVDGSGSRIDYGSRFADLFVGRQGAVGSASVTRGGVINMDAWQPRLFVGSADGASSAWGTLRIDGAGSLVSLLSPQSAAGAFDLPQANIGWGGTGTVEISGGGQLLLNGRGTSTSAQVAQTRMAIGQTVTVQTGSGPLTTPGTGTLNVSGAGSRVSVAGTDAAVYVGRNSGGTGALNLSAGAALDTTLLNVGLQGGVGTLQMNAGTLTLTGEHSGSTIGATLGIGLGTGSLGSVRVANGSTVTLSNAGSQGALLLVGGANSAPGGNGSLAVRASTVQVSGPQGKTGAVFGFNGNGQASFDNASVLDVGATGGVVVGWKPGSTGLLSLSNGSTLTAGYVGVSASGEGEGGAATLIVNDTSTVTAWTIEIGSKGYVGGTGTLIGSVINRGILSPGNSPGTLHVQGSFDNQAGGRLVLEVESDGHGGFVTDQLVFDAGSAVNLGPVQIEFRFLGATDPNAFQASGGFEIDSFLRQGSSALDHGLLGSASYTASSAAYQFTSFNFSADGGAVFQAQAQVVPEPGTWVLFGLGLGVGGWLQKRRRT